MSDVDRGCVGGDMKKASGVDGGEGLEEQKEPIVYSIGGGDGDGRCSLEVEMDRGQEEER